MHSLRAIIPIGVIFIIQKEKIYPAWDDYINYFIVSKYLKDRTTDLSSALIFEEMLDRNIYEAIWSRSQAGELAKRELESASITNIASLLDISSVEQDQLFWTLITLLVRFLIIWFCKFLTV